MKSFSFLSDSSSSSSSRPHGRGRVSTITRSHGSMPSTTTGQALSVLLIVVASVLSLSSVPSSVSADIVCPFVMSCDTPVNSFGQAFRFTVNRTLTNITINSTLVTMDRETIRIYLLNGSVPTQGWGSGFLSTVTSFYLKAKNSGLYLTNSGGNAVQSGYAASPAQSWNFEDTGAGNYWLRTMYDTTKVLDVYGSGLSGTNVDVWEKKSVTGDSNQRFIQTDRGSGYVSLHPSHDPTSALDVTGISTLSGAQIETWTWNGQDNQLWHKEPSCHQAIYSANTAVLAIPGEGIYTYIDYNGKGQIVVTKQNLDSVNCTLVEHYY